MSRDVPGNGAALRWAGTGAVVVGLHLGLGALLVGRPLPPPPPDAARAGIPIDLEPVTVPRDEAAATPAPPASPPEAELPPDVRPEVEPPSDDRSEAETAPDDRPEAEPAPPPEAAPARPEPPPAEPPPAEPPASEPPPVEPAGAEAPAPVSPPEAPPAPDDVEAMAARPLPPPRPTALPTAKAARRQAASHEAVREQAASQEAVRDRAEAREAARVRRREAGRRAARRNAADRQAGERRAGAVAARQEAEAEPRASASAGEIASWRGALMAHLNRFKRSPAGGGVGTARVGFSVDAGGGLSGAHLVASSGDPSLDAAAVAMIARANPVPAPPAGLGGRVALTIPIRFSGE